MRGSSSPLLLFGALAVMIDDREVYDDIDRLLTQLLAPTARLGRRGRNSPSYAATIDPRGRLRHLRHGVHRLWRDEAALERALDELVLCDRVRAIGASQPVRARSREGLVDIEESMVRVLVEHRAGMSIDFLVPFDLAVDPECVRLEDASQPTYVDRMADGRPHRVWPASAAAEAADQPDSQGLHVAIEHAEHALRRLPEHDLAWPEAANRLAALLGEQFRDSGYRVDIERAIELGHAAVDHPDAGVDPHIDLAANLGSRFELDGSIGDLEDAIEGLRSLGLFAGSEVVTGEDMIPALEAAREQAATEDADADEVQETVRAVETLNELLLMRYHATAERQWLYEAGGNVVSVLASIPDSVDVSRAKLVSQLGAISLILFESTGERDLLRSAVEYSGNALDGTEEDSPEFTRYLRDHALALLRSYEVIGDESQLVHAYHCLGRAIARVRLGAPERASILLGLATVGLYLPSAGGASAAAASLAVRAIEDALDVIPQSSPERARAYAMLASAQRVLFNAGGEIGRLRAAADAAERGTEAWETSLLTATVSQKLGAGERGATVHALAVDLLLELADRDPDGAAPARWRAFVLAEASKSRLLAEQISRGDMPAPADVPARLVERERSLLAALAAVDSAALAGRDWPGEGTPASRRREEMLRDLKALWDEIAERGTAAREYVAMRRGAALNREQIAALALDGAAILSLFVLESRTVLFGVPPGEAEPVVDEVALGEDGWSEVVRRFDRELPRSHGVDDFPPTWQAPLAELLARAGKLVGSSEPVVIIPHRDAHVLPWGLLASSWTTSGEAPTVWTVPALSVLDRLRRRAPSAHSGAAVFGNPTEDLRHAEAEAEAVARVLKSGRPQLGPAATRRAVEHATQHAAVLHVAAHAGYDADSPLDAHIELADGRWTVRDALAARLDAELVVLSGCETGRSGELAGDELAGLAQAFLHAGARALVVSLWKVDDAATAELMRAFHEARRGGGTAAALRQAADTMRAQRPHPWYWAAFTAVGDCT